MIASRPERVRGRWPGAVSRVRRGTAAAVILAAAAAALAGACTDEEPGRGVPVEALGYWTTSTPPYADRAFELRRDAVIFYTGTGLFDFTAHPVKEVEVSGAEDEGIVVTLHYTDGGMPYEFSFRFVPGERDEIRFANRPGIAWHREEPPWLGMEGIPSPGSGSS